MKYLIMCINTGIIYKNAAMAAKECGADKPSVSNCLAGKRETAKGYAFIRVPEDQSRRDYEQMRMAALNDFFKIKNMIGCRVELPEQDQDDAGDDYALYE